jgi:hypothetical protein
VRTNPEGAERGCGDERNHETANQERGAHAAALAPARAGSYGGSRRNYLSLRRDRRRWRGEVDPVLGIERSAHAETAHVEIRSGASDVARLWAGNAKHARWLCHDGPAGLATT